MTDRITAIEALVGVDQAVALARLTRDLRRASITLDPEEVRYLVKQYYNWQEQRIRTKARMRSLQKTGHPGEVIAWFARQAEILEDQIKVALDVYTSHHPIGQWIRSHKGLGPVITAGLLAHINIEKCPSVGKLWAHAGLAPGVKWEKGQRRPWNADLKVLCWKLGKSFVWNSSRPDSYYGKVYRLRKAYETDKNLKGDYAEQAAAALREKNYRADTIARAMYEKGLLPQGRIFARSSTYAVKLFLAHLWEYWRTYEGLPVELPYPIRVLGHTHYIPPQSGDHAMEIQLPTILVPYLSVLEKAEAPTEEEKEGGAGDLD